MAGPSPLSPAAAQAPAIGDGRDPYKHLQDPEQILWGLTLRQLAAVLLGVLAAIVFASWLSPLPTQLTLIFTIVIAGLPVVLSTVASSGDLAPWSAVRAVWRWFRSPRSYVPGANPCTGYAVLPPIGRERPARTQPAAGERPSLEELLPL